MVAKGLRYGPMIQWANGPEGPVGSTCPDLAPQCSRVALLAFVVAVFMAHENGDKQRLAKRRNVQGMLDETDPFILGIYRPP